MELYGINFMLLIYKLVSYESCAKIPIEQVADREQMNYWPIIVCIQDIERV